MNGLSGRGRVFVIAVMSLLVLLFYVTAAAHFDYTADDSFVYYQYARNLAGGDGPSFNRGTPSYGFTGPLWLMILSAGGATGADIPLLSKVLDLLFASVSIMLLFLFALELTRDVAVSFCASLAYSVNAWLLGWAGSGLETSLGVLLLLAFFLFLLRNQYSVAAGLLGLLTLVRPEAALLMVPMLLDLRVNSVDRGRALRTATRAVSVWLAVVLPWLAYAYAVFGSVLPASFGAGPAEMFNPRAMAGAAWNVVTTLGSADGAAVAALAVSLLTLVLGHRRRAVSRGDGDGGRTLPIFQFRQGYAGLLWIVSLPLGCIVFPVEVAPRHLLLVTPLITALAFFYLHENVRGRSSGVRYGAVLALTALIMLQNQFVYRQYVVPHVGGYAEGVESCLKPIGSWLNTHTGPGTVVMAADVGAVGYFSDRTICDYNGIVSADPPPRGTGGGDFTDLLRSGAWRGMCSPSFIVHRGTVPEELGDVPGLTAVFSRPFPGFTITGPGVVYFTLYRADYEAPEKLLTRR